MAWFKCIGSSSGGGANINSVITYMTDDEFHALTPDPSTPIVVNGYTYDIETTSTGGGDAAVQVTEYLDGALVQQVNFLYSKVKPDIFHDIKIDYGETHQSNWTITVKNGCALIVNGTEYTTENLDADLPAFYWSYSDAVSYTGCIGKSRTFVPFVPDAGVLYILSNSNRDLLMSYYLGSQRISENPNAEDYEFYLENVYVKTNTRYKTLINVGGSNASRDWQIEMNLGVPKDTTERSLITTEEQNREVYVQSNTLYFYNYLFNDTSSSTAIVQDFPNKDIVIKKENNLITVTADGVQVYSTANYSLPDATLSFFRYYTDYYEWDGIINYFGFKWLD